MIAIKIVFLTSSYYPYFSAIGKCVYNLVNEMKKNHEVIVISNMSILNLPQEEIFDNHKIIRVRTTAMKKRDIIQEQDEVFLKSKINEIKMISLRSFEYSKVIMSKTTTQKYLVKEYLKKLSNVENIDIIIPTCYPFESILASQKYKRKYNKNVKIIPFLFDKFSDSPTLHRNNINKKWKYKEHLVLEEKMIKDAEKVFYVDSWIDHTEKHFKKYRKKFIHVEHPLIVEYNHGKLNKKIKNEDNFIDIVYTGVLDKKVRSPFRTLKIISKLVEKNNKLRFHFYVLGNCGNELDEYHMEYPNNIFNHGQVKSDVALFKIMESNILLSIGNTDVSLIPSKIFEYMSCGKPIIHFYTSEDDRVISLLNNYNLGFCVKQDKEIDEHMINQITEFFDVNKFRNMPFDEVEKNFFEATPKFISKKIINSFSD
ncbi:hypothetical protein [Carnobacterium alterfunditum]|uniref:hypothetical protein n=1 Tax=Carnobacterium alterfunditum TaxID=28230 RepID=UPI003593E8F1